MIVSSVQIFPKDASRIAAGRLGQEAKSCAMDALHWSCACVLGRGNFGPHFLMNRRPTKLTAATEYSVEHVHAFVFVSLRIIEIIRGARRADQSSRF